MALFNGKLTEFFGLTDDENTEYMEEVQETQRTVRKPVSRVVPQTASVGYQQAVNDSSREPRFSGKIEQAVKNSSQRQLKNPPVQQTNSSKLVALDGGNRPVKNTKKESKVANQTGKISIIEPRVYSEAMVIAKRILAGESVLVNFDLLDEDQARRVVDFLTGAVYAEDGDIQRVGDEIFLCTPANVEIDTTVAQTLADASFFD
ncbi:cell division inhibitor SepF [Enterococcus sp. PF1-24]|uniref:cell division protein SepF n=1 Tax=unclassified Enterococcus TaxID=2608891 RepID=UPI0024731238|nr:MULTISPECIES: cell division protein SepF [unclassified Enterococcus]MDH6364450.1 cell division inhibitor SepF [Enterococcus sp. PFB1-1]MDH6401527.1 cell division inhibitor SepF [Enterococcus sp. PF1-24]